ncbi:MAG: Uma2 family endonuclease [Phycisphaeraceae bacterium]
MVTSIPHLRFRLDELEGRMPERLPWRLIRGELFMMSPAGSEHGRICQNIAVLLGIYLRQSKVGQAFGAETGYVLTRDPDTVLAPDASFITADRTHLVTERFFDGASGLAVEVISPSQSTPNATEKAEPWLELGARVVWLVWPKTKAVTVHLPDAEPRDYGLGETIGGIDFMPGFSCPVTEVFE